MQFTLYPRWALPVLPQIVSLPQEHLVKGGLPVSLPPGPGTEPPSSDSSSQMHTLYLGRLLRQAPDAA